MPRTRALLPVAAILIAGAALIGAGRSAETSQATTFSPTLTASVTDTTPGAHADVTYRFEIAAPDANFLDVVTFVPPDFGVAHDADVPDGAIAGELQATATLGLINNPCNSQLPVSIAFQEATTDLGDIYYGYQAIEDTDGDGLIEFVEHYPGFLTNLFPGVQPIQRLYGQTQVAGVWNILNFVVFEPGADIPFFPDLDPALGYPTFAVLNDPLAPMLVSPITDFCTPLSTTTTVFGVTRDDPATPGNNAGIPLRTNPVAPGTSTATSFVRSLWDADGDGIESNLDPCPYDPDTVWDPRASDPQGDADGDGLPATCDPDDHSYNNDYDNDQFLNRHDLCPFDFDWASDNDVDDIGDACDLLPNDPTDGGLSHRHVVCTTSVISVGGSGDTPPEPPCPSGPDLPAISVYPQPTSARAGDVISIGANLQARPGYGSGLPAVTVHFSVSGANSAQGSCLTDNGGSCEFNYLGAKAGDDTVTVTVAAFGITRMTTITWGLPPANDDFANAIEVTSLPFAHDVDPALASFEPGEDGDCSPGGSVWYRFTAGEDMLLEAEVESDHAPAIVGVFEGTELADLERIRCGYLGYIEPGAEAFETYGYFMAEAGETYYFSVSAFPYYYGPYTASAPSLETEFSLSEVSGVVIGDVNCDGEVTPADSLLALRKDAGLPITECDHAFGDSDCDGYVGVIDSLRILRADAGLPVPEIGYCPAVASAFA